MNPRVALLLSALAGYVSLSQEILWFRVISYATGGAPAAFAHLLGCFLVGLAVGSLVANHLAKRPVAQPGLLLGGLFLASAAVGYLSIPSTAQMFQMGADGGVLYAYLMVALVAFPGGVLFPLLCHYGIPPARAVGESLSGIYVANVLGSTFGPCFTTFVLMDRFRLPELVALVTAVALVGALVAVLAVPATGKARVGFVGVLALLVAAGAAVHADQYALLLERLHFKDEFTGRPYRVVQEGRSGVVAVGGDEADRTIYGGGIYDGTFNVSPVANENGIRRVFLVSNMRRQLTDVLEIGLASGSWARVLADHQDVKSLTAVEINPAYLDVIRQFPEQASVLDDPKISLQIDDGRRWLLRNPERKFDVIVMNTTFFWRSQSSNLLSSDFLRLCKAHLKPGGVLFLNTTHNEDVRYTAAQVFPHVTRVDGFAALSDVPFDMTVEERRAALRRFQSNGRPVFAPDIPGSEAVLEELATRPLPDEGDALRARTDLWEITDDNMASEYKVGFTTSNPSRSWGQLFERLRKGGGGIVVR
ncbi:MAG TPA: methyltransferase domain-containing protein [Myxococcaceae bacterium]|nr:methyltransferase domain-containing protein [Myxococcaceae bacterium]